jgi:Wiskott-Aldrich syndrome protein
MNSRAYQFQLQAAEAAAAAAAAPVVHAAEGGEPEVTPKAPLLKIQAAQGTADEPAPRQGSGLAPTTMGTIGNAEATATKCPECHKWFASEKAMFGHLRKHPERGYKGATRPTATASAAAAAAVAGDKKPTKKAPRKETGVPAINMAAAAAATKALGEAELSTKWPASAKRGRTPVAPMPQASSCSEEEEAAMILLELASSSRTSSETQQQQSVEPVRAPDAVSGHQIQMSVVEEPMLLDHPTEAEQQIVQLENALELSAESQTPAVKQVTDLVITTEAVLIVVPANNKPIFPSLDSGAGDKVTKKQRRVTNPEQMAASTPPPSEGAVVRTPPARRIPSPASDKKHTCQTCGKSFPTHQALGGHMASHVKGAKTTSARHDDLTAVQAMHNILARRDQQSAGNGNGNVTIPASAGALQERQDAQPPPAQAPTQQTAPTPQTAAPHVCDECHLIFPSGQALGGHKRKHWFPEKQQATKAAPAPAPAPAPRDFDLNEVPKEGQGENNNQP